MNRKEIKDFIFLVTGKCYHFYFINIDKNKYSCNDFLAATLKSKKTKRGYIVINQKRWNTYSEELQKYAILHELGHLQDPTKYKDSKNGNAKSELFAAHWSIKKAGELNLPDVLKISIWELNRWKLLKYHSANRPYVLANRLAKKQGII